MVLDQTELDLEIQFVESIADIGAQNWNRLSGSDNPFNRYEFLWALEKTGCTTENTGWKPYHISVVSTSSTKILAIMPLYLKTNSYGEYVFDWSWANAYQEHGYSYYPKFVTSLPFTPSVGSRIFIDESLALDTVIALINKTLKQKAEILGVSSWHILFPFEEQQEKFKALGMHTRTACQFHWFNKGYNNFEEFLDKLSSRKRKNINKERLAVKSQQISFEIIEGADISESMWQKFYGFYQSTYAMRGMQGYLSEEFFSTLADTMPESFFLVTANKENDCIAAALFFKSSTTLYGRYWGSLEDYRFLHFETCFYQGQEYCIRHGLKSFDSGAQGEHKISRGFEPVKTFSNHWIANENFAAAIEKFIEDEKSHMENYMQQARQMLPFKKEG
ncbi:MAG: GNAT family N-acetyltransferase [SAR86 cluster bacterium]|uniref:GNAT family N-acetyltransferase n=1 Tax=SAR86 cluster bacterium TaxID=2030880 RepID=A0A2A4MSD6_9GAMM|nr:MAG: GNAT family N-acetyltransferase [SAR86 cluster bacterium]